MSGKKLFQAMSYVDERFVEEAENLPFPKRGVFPLVKVGSIAACLCLILFGVLQMYPYLVRNAPESVQPGANPPVIEPGMAKPGDIPITNEPEEVGPKDIPPAASAPTMMVRIHEVTKTGFVGIVQNYGGFTVFEDGTEITVIIDMETDPDFIAEDYQTGDLIHVMYTAWDENGKTILASVLGVVNEPICD